VNCITNRLINIAIRVDPRLHFRLSGWLNTSIADYHTHSVLRFRPESGDTSLTASNQQHDGDA